IRLTIPRASAACRPWHCQRSRPWSATAKGGQSVCRHAHSMAVRLRSGWNINELVGPAPRSFSLHHAFCRRCHYIGQMPTLIAGVVAVILLYALLQMFRAANPVVLARAIKIGGGVVALAVAAFTGVKGELAVAIPLGIFGAGLLG